MLYIQLCGLCGRSLGGHRCFQATHSYNIDFVQNILVFRDHFIQNINIKKRAGGSLKKTKENKDKGPSRDAKKWEQETSTN